MSQDTRVLEMLRHGWVCGTEFLDERLPRYSARICELRKRGFVIVRQPCDNPRHRHASRQDQWRLIAAPSEDGQIHAVYEEVGL